MSEERSAGGTPFDPGSKPPRKRYHGPRVVLVGALIIAALTALVVWRIVETSGPGPDPNSIPPRPSGRTGDST